MGARDARDRGGGRRHAVHRPLSHRLAGVQRRPLADRPESLAARVIAGSPLACRCETIVCMAERTVWETLKAEGEAAVDRLKDLIREGNVRRVRIRQGTRVIAEFPLTA